MPRKNKQPDPRFPKGCPVCKQRYSKCTPPNGKWTEGVMRSQGWTRKQANDYLLLSNVAAHIKSEAKGEAYRAALGLSAAIPHLEWLRKNAKLRTKNEIVL